MSKEKISKSAHNQELTNRHKAERNLRKKGLFVEPLVDIEKLRVQRRENLRGVTIYKRGVGLLALEEKIDAV